MTKKTVVIDVTQAKAAIAELNESFKSQNKTVATTAERLERLGDAAKKTAVSIRDQRAATEALHKQVANLATSFDRVTDSVQGMASKVDLTESHLARLRDRTQQTVGNLGSLNNQLAETRLGFKGLQEHIKEETAVLSRNIGLLETFGDQLAKITGQMTRKNTVIDAQAAAHTRDARAVDTERASYSALSTQLDASTAAYLGLAKAVDTRLGQNAYSGTNASVAGSVNASTAAYLGMTQAVSQANLGVGTYTQNTERAAAATRAETAALDASTRAYLNMAAASGRARTGVGGNYGRLGQDGAQNYGRPQSWDLNTIGAGSDRQGPDQLFTRNMQRLRQSAEEAGNATRRLGDEVDGAVKKHGYYYASLSNVFRIGANLAIFGTMFKTVAVLEQATGEAYKWAKAISEIRTISDQAAKSAEQWQGELIGLSNAFGIPVTEAAEGAYLALSNQITNTSNTLPFLRQEVSLSVAAVSTLNQAVNATSSVLAAWNLNISETSRVNAILFQAVNLGRFRLENIAESIGRVSILSAQMGVSVTEQSAALSLISRQGVPASEAMTLFRNVMFALIKPTDRMKEVLLSWGYASGESAIKALGLVETIRRLSEEANRGGDRASEFVEMFGRIRAVVGNAALTQNDYNAELANYAKASDIYLAAQEERMKSLDTRTNIQRESLRNFTTLLGKELLEAVVKFAEAQGGAASAVVRLGGYLADGLSIYLSYQAAVRATHLTQSLFAGSVAKTAAELAATTQAANAAGMSVRAYELATMKARMATAAMTLGLTLLAEVAMQMVMGSTKARFEMIATASEAEAQTNKIGRKKLEEARAEIDKISTVTEQAIVSSVRNYNQFIATVQLGHTRLGDSLKTFWTESVEAYKIAIEQPMDQLSKRVQAQVAMVQKTTNEIKRLSEDIAVKTAAEIDRKAIVAIDRDPRLNELQKLQALIQRREQMEKAANAAILGHDRELAESISKRGEQLDKEIEARADRFIKAQEKLRNAADKDATAAAERGIKDEETKQARILRGNLQLQTLLREQQRQGGQQGQQIIPEALQLRLQGLTPRDLVRQQKNLQLDAGQTEAIQGLDLNLMKIQNTIANLQGRKDPAAAAQLEALQRRFDAGLQAKAGAEIAPDQVVAAQKVLLELNKAKAQWKEREFELDKQHLAFLQDKAKKEQAATQQKEAQVKQLQALLKSIDSFDYKDMTPESLQKLKGQTAQVDTLTSQMGFTPQERITLIRQARSLEAQAEQEMARRKSEILLSEAKRGMDALQAAADAARQKRSAALQDSAALLTDKIPSELAKPLSMLNSLVKYASESSSWKLTDSNIPEDAKIVQQAYVSIGKAQQLLSAMQLADGAKQIELAKELANQLDVVDKTIGRVEGVGFMRSGPLVNAKRDTEGLFALPEGQNTRTVLEAIRVIKAQFQQKGQLAEQAQVEENRLNAMLTMLQQRAPAAYGQMNAAADQSAKFRIQSEQDFQRVLDGTLQRLQQMQWMQQGMQRGMPQPVAPPIQQPIQLPPGQQIAQPPVAQPPVVKLPADDPRVVIQNLQKAQERAEQRAAEQLQVQQQQLQVQQRQAELQQAQLGEFNRMADDIEAQNRGGGDPIAGMEFGGSVRDTQATMLRRGEFVVPAPVANRLAPYLYTLAGQAGSVSSSSTQVNFGDIHVNMPSGSTGVQVDALISELQRRKRLGTFSL